MNNKFRKLMAAALTICTVSSFAMFGASAAEAPEAYADGDYTAKLSLMHAKKDEPSMSGAAFDHDMELVVDGENTQVIVYGFLPGGDPAKPPVKNFHLMVNEVKMMAQVPEGPLVDRVADVSNSTFKITAGETYPAQRMIFNISTADIPQLITGVSAGGSPTGMPMPVNMRFIVSEITPVNAPEVLPDEQIQHAMELTAKVTSPEASYIVIVPEALAMGTLSTTEVNIMDYTVEVKAQNLGNGTVTVTATSEGFMQSDSGMLFFNNDFDDQTTGVSAEFGGRFRVAPTAVAKAPAGNYQATVDFDITYNP